MSLEELFEEMEAAAEKRFTSWEKRAERIASLAEALDGYTARTTNDRARLDHLSLTLKKAHYTHPAKSLEDAIRGIDTVRSDYRDVEAPLACYSIVRGGGRYATRFDAIEEAMERQDPSYDDLALVLDHLRTDSYLNRRAPETTRAHKEALERRIVAQLTPRTTGRAERWAYRAAGAVMAACMVFAAVPAAAYSALF